MRRYVFTFDGKSSTDFGTFLAKSNMFDAPERDFESVVIPGKNGELTLDNGRYRNFAGTVEAYVPRRMQGNVPGLRAYLGSKVGYCRYTDSIHPEEYRMARFVGGFVVSESDRVGAALTLNFDCMPQRWLIDGEREITYTANGTIYNPTLYNARPLIRAYGTGTFTINGVSIKINSASQYTDIDCELMDAFKGATNCNGNIVLTNGEFPVIAPGTNTITKSGITSLVITPRWWTL